MIIFAAFIALTIALTIAWTIWVAAAAFADEIIAMGPVD